MVNESAQLWSSSARASSLPETDFIRQFPAPCLVRLLGFLDVDREAALDRFVNVLHQFLERVTLGGATGDGGHFRPVSALIRFVNHDFDFQFASVTIISSRSHRKSKSRRGKKPQSYKTILCYRDVRC